MSRRALIAGGLATAVVGAVGLPSGSVGAATATTVPLPSPEQVRREFTRMVQLGPRLTGSTPHKNFIEWLAADFAAAGLEMLPRDEYVTDRWLAEGFGLDILTGLNAGPVKVATYFPRSQETGSGGVEGPLVYGGVLPLPSVDISDLGTIPAALDQWGDALRSWVAGLPSLLGGTKGSILVVDLPMPLPLSLAAFLPLATHLNWPGHTITDWLLSDYKRAWIEPGLGFPLAEFQALGAKGVVFILDSSYEALAGAYIPFLHGFEPIPALFVDRVTGAKLRRSAFLRPKTRLTLTATRKRTEVEGITAVLPGKTDEVIILNTHTDGQGFVEENGGVAFLQLARHFASLPADERLDRTLVFAAWPGHMTFDLPQLKGWIANHPDLVARAAAALTIEHLGCTEWTDNVEKGYFATGEPETFAIWTTQGKMFELTRDSVIAHALPRTALLRPPVQFGVGGAFQGAGVPQIGALAGPNYLLTIAADGDLDKLDEHLAARQIAWIADLVKRIDAVPATVLHAGDPTLGLPTVP